MSGPYKAKLFHSTQLWVSSGPMELASTRWTDWTNTAPLHEALEYSTPADLEAPCTHDQASVHAVSLTSAQPRTLYALPGPHQKHHALLHEEHITPKLGA